MSRQTGFRLGSVNFPLPGHSVYIFTLVFLSVLCYYDEFISLSLAPGSLVESELIRMWSNRSNSAFLRPIRSNRGTCYTVTGLAFIIIAFLFAYKSFGENTHSPHTLRMVHIVFRHGERTPSCSYPNDPYKDPKLWPDGWGQLTNKGKLQMYELGIQLRQQYKGYLNDLYTPDELWMRSSYADRCQMSALALLAGLYPPTGRQMWLKELPWQPIPINTIPREVDDLIVVKAECRRYTLEKNKTDIEIASSLSEEERSLYKYLTEHTGQPIKSIEDIECLYNTLAIQYNQGLKLPEWTHRVFPEPMRRLAALNLASYTWNEELKKLRAGVMLREWREHMSARRTGLKPQKKMYMYSGHDLTLVSLYRALGFNDLILPGFGASLRVELHLTDDEEHHVDLLYYNSSSSVEPIRLTLPGCSTPCSLDDFLTVTQHLDTPNWASSCSS